MTDELNLAREICSRGPNLRPDFISFESSHDAEVECLTRQSTKGIAAITSTAQLLRSDTLEGVMRREFAGQFLKSVDRRTLFGTIPATREFLGTEDVAVAVMAQPFWPRTLTASLDGIRYRFDAENRSIVDVSKHPERLRDQIISDSIAKRLSELRWVLDETPTRSGVLQQTKDAYRGNELLYSQTEQIMGKVRLEAVNTHEGLEDVQLEEVKIYGLFPTQEYARRVVSRRTFIDSAYLTIAKGIRGPDGETIGVEALSYHFCRDTGHMVSAVGYMVEMDQLFCDLADVRRALEECVRCS